MIINSSQGKRRLEMSISENGSQSAMMVAFKIYIFSLSMLLSISSSQAKAESEILWSNKKMLEETAGKFRPLHKMLKEFVDQEATPSVELLLTQNGKVIFWEVFGQSDLEAAKQMQKDTICYLASSTKPISATCLMMLVDEGKIGLDDPVSKFLHTYENTASSGSKQKYPAPTIRQLLSHTSGMAGLREMTPSGQRAIRESGLSLKQSAGIIAEEPLLAAPGERFSYGGQSFNVAGRVLEVVTSMPFDRFMKTRLLDPLGMEDTTFKPTADQGHRVAGIYKPAPWGGQMNLFKFDLERDSLQKSLILVGGGLYSSAKDMSFFLQMHLNNGEYNGKRFLSQTAVAEMQKDQIGNATVAFHPVSDSRDYGLGWVRDRFGRDGETLSISHPGAFGTTQWIDIDRNITGVLFTPMPLKFAHHLHRLVRAQVLALFPRQE